ncbi:Calmodulin-binding transcription activator 4 [Dichanthelium oligosanthes]|uniref:Calmodulin-binding transcription activator 4 n=1 Tax=Dichanthelium oligosanthes TaxID=888268 RepID=A0A1E5WBW9_9POAL|nr:Calmodulin-binding transcription activator 4 [Dichanthelium oligosanthes]
MGRRMGKLVWIVLSANFAYGFTVSGLDIQKLQQVVKTRWLKPQEVLQILQNHELFTISHKPPQKPPSGSWFLFNRRVLRYFRNDGFEWQKKKNGKTINEAHERLKVDNMEALNCYYARGGNNPTFQRRIYWMLDPAYEHIVLVHYRDVLEGSISVSARNDSSTSNQNGSASRAEVHNSPGGTSDLILPCPNSFSPGSAEEVSSRTVTINNETNSTGGSDFIQHKEALRKLKMQLSLEDKEDSYVIAEEVPSNNEHVIFHGIQNEEPDNCTNFEDIFNGLEFSGDHTKETGTHPCPSAIDVLKNSDTWLEEDQLEAFLHPASMIPTENQWFQIHEVSPELAFSSESTKVIVIGDFICNPSLSSWAMLFGDVKVPVEIIRQGVIRCHTPCLNAGKVTMCLIDGNGEPCSEAREFEFLEKPTKSMINGNRIPCSEAQDIKAHQTPTKSNDELLLLLNYVQILFDGHGCEVFSKFSPQLTYPGCGFLVNQMDIIKKTYGQVDPEKTVNSVMEVLLNDKLKQWLSSKCEQNNDGDHLLPKQYHGVTHTIAALGYDLALKPLLSSGVPINFRDANGWTALHWAARFGREDMVVALLNAGAAAGALSHPTSEDPAAKTPASIALAYGFKGLSAFLSEAQLTTHLDSIESKENGKCKANGSGDGIRSAVDRISDKSTHVHGGTDDQLALKDSLGAVRNAVQAAARIQAVYRVFSFKKKQEMALQNSCLSVHDTVAVSHGMQEKAALSIQKNFRCWKKRKEFLKLRKNIIKLQARVRAHQERKKYKELLRSVGVLEKVMLRWYRKGVGLRGFNSGAMPIDEEVEEDVAKVFRKLRVETAIDEAVSRVSCIISSPKAMQQYRRMLQRFQQAKVNYLSSQELEIY